MANLTSAVGAKIKRIICSGLSGAEGFYGLVSSVGLPTGIAEYFIEKGQGLACGEPSPDASGYAEPGQFPNGQCETTIYNITFDMIGEFPDGTETVFPTGGQAQGPVSLRMIEVNGQPRVGGFSGDTLVFDRGFGGGVTTTGFRNQVATPQSGGDDSCGGSPTEAPEPVDEIEVVEDLIYEDKDGIEITIPGVSAKVFPGCINEDGLRFPFEVDLGFAKLCGKAGIGVDIGDLLVGENPVSPSVDFDLCPSEIEDLEQGAAEEKERLFVLDPPRGGGSTSPESGLAGNNSTQLGEDEKPILAVFVKSARGGVNPGGGKTIIIPGGQQTFPTLVVNYIALVRFKIAIPLENGEMSYSYSEDIRVKSVDAYVPCPAVEGAADYEVIWEAGWEGTAQAARAKSCCAFCASSDPRDSAGNIDRCRID